MCDTFPSGCEAHRAMIFLLLCRSMSSNRVVGGMLDELQGEGTGAKGCEEDSVSSQILKAQ